MSEKEQDPRKVCIDLDDPKAVEKLEELAELLRRQREERLERLMDRFDGPTIGEIRRQHSESRDR